MRIALAELEFDIKGSGNKSTFQPMYLKAEDRNKVSAFVQFLDKNLKKKKSDINIEILDDLFPSYKVVRALQVSSLRSYSYLSLTYKDIFQEEESEDRKTTDITSFIKEKTSKNLKVSNMQPSEFREKVFDIINDDKGFVTIEERAKMIEKIEKEIGIPDGLLVNFLYIQQNQYGKRENKYEYQAQLEIVYYPGNHVRDECQNAQSCDWQHVLPDQLSVQPEFVEQVADVVGSRKTQDYPERKIFQIRGQREPAQGEFNEFYHCHVYRCFGQAFLELCVRR